MNTESQIPADQAFARVVHDALRHLYDAAVLGASPLLRQLMISRPTANSADLRRLLIEAIELQKPAATTPQGSPDWRYYRILNHRFVEQFSQQQVADNLALSIRQLRREEAEAVQLLVEDLRRRSGLRADGSLAHDGALHDKEISWVDNSFPREMIDAQTLIDQSLATMDTLLQSARITLRRRERTSLPPVFAQPGSLQQALLNALSVALSAAPQGWLTISALPWERVVRILVDIEAPRPIQSLTREQLESLEVTRRLVGLSAGTLEVALATAGKSLAIALVLPVDTRAVVLAIDDNADALGLIERALSGTRYGFVGARNADEALALALESAPAAILVDIMLPGVDGWRLLGRLREHPQVRGTPIIVCTILPQAELALALGAAAFLHKPFTREALLALLDRFLAPPAGQ